MWAVIKNWDGYEVDIQTFDTEEEANENFNESMEHTSAQLYLTKVSRTFNLKSEAKGGY